MGSPIPKSVADVPALSVGTVTAGAWTRARFPCLEEPSRKGPHPERQRPGRDAGPITPPTPSFPFPRAEKRDGPIPLPIAGQSPPFRGLDCRPKSVAVDFTASPNPLPMAGDPHEDKAAARRGVRFAQIRCRFDGCGSPGRGQGRRWPSCPNPLPSPQCVAFRRCRKRVLEPFLGRVPIPLPIRPRARGRLRPNPLPFPAMRCLRIRGKRLWEWVPEAFPNPLPIEGGPSLPISQIRCRTEAHVAVRRGRRLAQIRCHPPQGVAYGYAGNGSGS